MSPTADVPSGCAVSPENKDVFVASPAAALRFLSRLTHAAGGAQSGFRSIQEQFGLSPTWYDLLSTVASHGGKGCSQTDLAAALNLAESSVCNLVDRLHEAGLLHRFRDKQDRRRSLLLLSSGGREQFDAASAASQRALLQWLADTSDEHLDQLGIWLESFERRTRSAADVFAATREGGEDEARPNVPSRYREAG
jgi:DNA-binding MarR family transcriptional regulator